MFEVVLLDKVAPAAAKALDIYWFCLLACLAWSFDAFWLFMVPLEEAFALICCTLLALAALALCLGYWCYRRSHRGRGYESL